jgi:hypothetical protein
MAGTAVAHQTWEKAFFSAWLNFHRNEIFSPRDAGAIIPWVREFPDDPAEVPTLCRETAKRRWPHSNNFALKAHRLHEL